MSVTMKNSSDDILNLIERLQEILVMLDEDGHAIPAIRVEEAINVLRQDREDQETSDGN